VTKKAPVKLNPAPTHYANVDLDVYSQVPLDGFVEALGHEAFVLFVGGGPRKFEAHLELASSHMAMSADDTISRADSSHSAPAASPTERLGFGAPTRVQRRDRGWP
jgi:hypothetical protein